MIDSPALSRRVARLRGRRGFTLLEVLLALAILVGSLATIGELTRIGMSYAHRAAAMAEAQLYCESKLAEITAGIVAPAATSSAPRIIRSSYSAPIARF